MKENYRAWEIHPQDFNDTWPIQDQIRFLVSFAILAPSSHNCQPWHFVIQNSSILLKPDPARSLPVSDRHGRHMHIALGCALTNLLVAADYYGLEPHVEYFPDEESVAKISFRGLDKPSKKDQDHLIFFISKRLMNRNHYENRSPDREFLERVRNLSTDDVQLELMDDVGKKSALTDVVLHFRDKIFDNKPFRGELADYKRTNLTRSFLGIPGFTMGFNTPLSLIAPWLIRHVNVMRFIKKADEETLKEHTPLLVFINTRENEKIDWIRAGEVAEHMMLEATRSGLSVAISALPQMAKEFRDVLGSPLHPQVFFRVGYATKTVAHAPRLPAERVTTVLT